MEAGRSRQTWRQDPWADAPPQSKKSKRSDEEGPRDEGIDRAVPDGDFDSMSVGSHHSQGAWQKWNNQTHQKNRSTRRGRGYIGKKQICDSVNDPVHHHWMQMLTQGVR